MGTMSETSTKLATGGSKSYAEPSYVNSVVVPEAIDASIAESALESPVIESSLPVYANIWSTSSSNFFGGGHGTVEMGPRRCCLASA